jgi:hypothetical protein
MGAIIFFLLLSVPFFSEKGVIAKKTVNKSPVRFIFRMDLFGLCIFVNRIFLQYEIFNLINFVYLIFFSNIIYVCLVYILDDYPTFFYYFIIYNIQSTI